MEALVVVFQVELLLQTEKVMATEYLVKVMMVETVVAVELTHFVAAEVVEVLVKSVEIVELILMSEALITNTEVMVVMAQLLQLQVLL